MAIFLSNIQNNIQKGSVTYDELFGTLNDHIDSTESAHLAASISFDGAPSGLVANNVQDSIEELAISTVSPGKYLVPSNPLITNKSYYAVDNTDINLPNILNTNAGDSVTLLSTIDFSPSVVAFLGQFILFSDATQAPSFILNYDHEITLISDSVRWHLTAVQSLNGGVF